MIVCRMALPVCRFSKCLLFGIALATMLFALILHLEISVTVSRLRFIATATANCVVCRPNVGQTIIDIYICYICMCEYIIKQIMLSAWLIVIALLRWGSIVSIRLKGVTICIGRVQLEIFQINCINILYEYINQQIIYTGTGTASKV